MAIRPYSELTQDEKNKFGSEEAYKEFMAKSSDITPMPDGGNFGQPITSNPGTNPDGSPIQQTTPTLTDPSQVVQAQAGAAMRQPTLPTRNAVTRGLALQQVTPSTL